MLPEPMVKMTVFILFENRKILGLAWAIAAVALNCSGAASDFE
jgi:hypothetical protein